MSKRSEGKTNRFAKLRAAAEKAMQFQGFDTAQNAGDVNKIFQELQVYQIELEMQNDELRQANEQLEYERLRFVSMYDLAPVGYFIVNEAGFVQQVNTAGRHLLEAGPTEIVRKRMSVFVAPDYAENFYRFFRELINSERRSGIQVELISGLGRRFHALVEGIAVGRLSQYYLTVVDISETIAGRIKLTESNNRLELALQASSAGTWSLDTKIMKFSFDNHSRQVCHLDETEFDNSYLSFLSILHAADRKDADQQFRAAINENGDINLICRIVHGQDMLRYLSIRGHGNNLDENGNLVGILWDVTENRRMEQEAEKLREDSQKRIATAALHAEENERKRISEALHDSVSQLLYGIRIHLGQLTGQSLKEGTLLLNNLLNEAITETRNLSFELAPSILEYFGLQATIEELADRLTSPALRFALKCSGLAERFDLMLESTSFRIIQELVNNCLKHSGASLVTIRIRKSKQLKISVEDNGVGFDVNAMTLQPKGTGLSSIASRVSLYNGTINMQSEINKGTLVNITLNYE